VIYLLVLFLFTFPAFTQELVLKIPPVKTSFDVANQPIAITASATISGAGDVFRIEARADLSDLQDHITDLLRAEVTRNERCGERLSVDRATLVPAPPSSQLTAFVHYEKWACAKAFGKEIAKRIVGGNATVPVKLTPEVAANEIQLTPEVGTITADGSLGEVLRSGSLGAMMREKIGQSILKAMRKGANLKATLPPGVESIAKIQTARFFVPREEAGGRLWFEIGAEVRMPERQLRSLIEHGH
jgi:hypothetical protein